MTFGTGLLDGSRILCLENMVVDDEIIGMVKRILTGIEVSEETLAVDLIKKMGFNGNYLFDNHTRAHVRELWQAKLGETGNYDGWKNAGAKSTTEKAQEKVAEILAAPAPSSRPTSAPSSTRSSPPRPGRRRPSNARRRVTRPGARRGPAPAGGPSGAGPAHVPHPPMVVRRAGPAACAARDPATPAAATVLPFPRYYTRCTGT